MFRKSIIYFVMLMIFFLPIAALAAEQLGNSEKTESLTLQECLDLALINSKQIQTAEKNVRIAQAAVDEARAAFWPDVTYQGARDQSNVAQYQTGIRYEKTDFKAGVNATLPLYTGGILSNNLKLAEIGLASSKESLRKAKQSLAYDVKQTFYNIWLAEQMLLVQQNSYNNLERHFRQLQSRYKAETASKLEVLRAEVQRDTIKPKVISAQNRMILVKMELAMMIGYPKDKEYKLTYTSELLQPSKSAQFILEHVLEEAYLNRPEIRQILLQEESLHVLTAMEKAGYKPNVSVTAGYGVKSKDIGSDGWNDAWTLTFSVGGKIYCREIQAQIEQSKGKEDVSAIQEAYLRDQIRLDAEQSMQNLAVSLENIRVNEATIGLAKESLRITQVRVDNGMATTMDLMDDQLALDQAFNGYYQALVSHLIAEAKMKLVMGNEI